MGLRATEFKQRRADLRAYNPDGKAILLASKKFDSNCISKKRFGFNTASEIATDFWEKGHFDMEPYFCLRCFRYHVGHRRGIKARYLCAWCGNHIKKHRLDSHARWCGRILV